MKHIVGLSGGKDSTAMALRLAEVEPKDYTYIFTPTGNEPPELLAHLENMECLLKMQIIRITNGTLESHMDRMNALPSNRMRWCTRILKIEPTITYFKSVAPAVMYVGLRADEEERQGIYGDIVQSDFPMRRWGWTETDVMDYLHERGISIPTRTSCEWCYDQKLSEWRRLKKSRPESYAAAVAWEEKTGHTFRSPSRDTQPAQLVQLGAKFDAGFIPRGDSDQIEMFDAPEFRKCRVCSL
ncbi:MAG: phosphoadenosine phosphosulfate reductase family protein [Planctomycetota bacterium]|nr:phosphoadenosine phosphosulfate reductase family protein [Planctomycetota bacterium]